MAPFPSPAACRGRSGPLPSRDDSPSKPRFHSSATRQTGVYVVRFAKAGTYRYCCTIHPNMQGRVVVS
ncbi:MAG: hypothetical protein JWM71_1342 [Solirubrobacteraceae bacterium]|nr:hypothetical protein [Solirubrobacteraceae bacterium]